MRRSELVSAEWGGGSAGPILTLLDAFGRRWALRILWELRSDALTFRALRRACDDISPSVLNTRLRELRALGLVVVDTGGYALTDDGRLLAEHFALLDSWANDWAQRNAARPT